MNHPTENASSSPGKSHATFAGAQGDNASKWPHRMAVALTCATFPLIWVGGLVTTYDAGMAVPDWPTTYGYNMFLYPISTWLSAPWNLFIEHGHRLFASLVGLITIAFMIVVFRRDERPWLRAFSVLCLAGVIGQGLLGGMRVRLNDVTFARLHGIIGPTFFALCVAAMAFTSRWWKRNESVVVQNSTSLTTLTWTIAILTYFQLILGAHVRHVPVNLNPQSFQVIAIAHVVLGLLLIAHVILLGKRVFFQRDLRAVRWLSRGSLILLSLFVFQIVLGVATWSVKYGWPNWLPAVTTMEGFVVQEKNMTQATIITGHVATGSLILVSSIWLSIRCSRMLKSKEIRLSQKAPVVLSEVVA